eukprot:CAMPEP_0179293468 /NCGR_PEP_ID=MMETSP0797-20121207/43388_1 /TAXON_ID=47934 /ORGANISM="Dinophysis acuminata, Strain DAEP01" /LENGTH=127 /DNA_ID=CAMNT_0021002615 /DNA_START=66 /DNA_END=446 /DNA_ORIENTATION=-
MCEHQQLDFDDNKAWPATGRWQSGLASKGKVALQHDNMSQHSFRSWRRHYAKARQEHTIETLRSRLAHASRTLARWEAWWYWHKEDHTRELLSFKPDCTEEPLDFCFQTTPKLDSCNVSCAAHVNDE